MTLLEKSPVNDWCKMKWSDTHLVQLQSQKWQQCLHTSLVFGMLDQASIVHILSNKVKCLLEYKKPEPIECEPRTDKEAKRGVRDMVFIFKVLSCRVVKKIFWVTRLWYKVVSAMLYLYAENWKAIAFFRVDSKIHQSPAYFDDLDHDLSWCHK